MQVPILNFLLTTTACHAFTMNKFVKVSHIYIYCIRVFVEDWKLMIARTRNEIEELRKSGVDQFLKDSYDRYNFISTRVCAIRNVYSRQKANALYSCWNHKTGIRKRETWIRAVSTEKYNYDTGGDRRLSDPTSRHRYDLVNSRFVSNFTLFAHTERVLG